MALDGDAHAAMLGRMSTTDTATQVRAIREAHGLTQGTLGELLGVHWTSVARWEGGTSSPPAPTARLLRLLEVRPELVALLRSWVTGPAEKSG